MKYFRLAKRAYRKNIDLRLYKDDIAVALAKVKPTAQIFVERNGFYTIPELKKRIHNTKSRTPKKQWT